LLCPTILLPSIKSIKSIDVSSRKQRVSYPSRDTLSSSNPDETVFGRFSGVAAQVGARSHHKGLGGTACCHSPKPLSDHVQRRKSCVTMWQTAEAQHGLRTHGWVRKALSFSSVTLQKYSLSEEKDRQVLVLSGQNSVDTLDDPDYTAKGFGVFAHVHSSRRAVASRGTKKRTLKRTTTTRRDSNDKS
jgi:hypothetical protein